MTTIRYFIPEDGDNELQPNVFLAPKPRQSGMPPTLGQVKSAFPLPGRYHFRFKTPLAPGGDREGGKNAVAVWMDCVEDRQPIPVWKNTVIAKVTRVGVEDEEDDDDDDSDFGTSARASTASAPRPAPAPAAQQQPPPPQEPMLDIFDGPAPAVTHSAPTSNNLFDTPNPASGASLLNMDAGGYHGAPSHGAANDFLGMTSTPSPHQQQYPGGQTPGYPPQQQQMQTPGYPHHQQQQQQRPPSAPHSGNNAFDSFGNQQGNQQQGPFGNLAWK